MKAILMSIRPEWVAKILNGEKTIEIRKIKENQQCVKDERNDFLLYQLEQKRSDLLSIYRHMDKLEDKRERVVLEDELL